MALKELYRKVVTLLQSKQGRNFLLFLVFLAISTVLWFVMTLNDIDQCDVKIPVKLTNVPDSVTIISSPPEYVLAGLKTRGAQRLKFNIGSVSPIEVDFRLYRQRNQIKVSNTDLKALVRNNVGGATVLLVAPDSLNLLYTSRKGVKMPVSIDCSVTAGAQSTLLGKPKASVDSVLVYSATPIPGSLKNISTEHISIDGLNTTTSYKARLNPPAGMRVVPDSIDVTFSVEPLIVKRRSVVVEPVNVPHGLKLITFPAKVDVVYMIAMSDYKNSEPRVKVTADYNTISKGESNIRLRISDVSANIQNVHLAADSAEFIIEHL